MKYYDWHRRDNIRDVSYLSIIVLVTAAILTGLFFYNKGTIKEVSGNLALSQNINLDFQRAATKPAESNRYYVIFYVNAANNSSTKTTLRMQAPVDPCQKYERYNYNYYQSPNPNKAAYDACLKGTEYQQYQRKEKEYELSYRTGLELMTPKNQKCELNSTYEVNNRYPNIGAEIINYEFQPNENKAGTLVFSCPENSGKFVIKYKNASLDLNI